MNSTGAPKVLIGEYRVDSFVRPGGGKTRIADYSGIINADLMTRETKH